MRAFVALAVAVILTGCANSALDRDWRTKVADVVPVSLSATGTPPSLHADLFRVDFRQVTPLPSSAGLTK